MSYDLPAELRVESDGGIRVVVLNRPDHLNAIDQTLHAALAKVWRQLAADQDARVVIVTGAGRSFSAGGDLLWIESFLTDTAARDDSIREGAQIIEEMLRFPLPVITAVNGPAVGLGASIAALSDIVLIADTAHLADPHVSVGLAAGDGAAALWPLLTPLLRSREFLFTGDPIDARTAVELGLASRVVAADDLLAEAHSLATKLAGQPTEALRATKRVVNMFVSQALAGPVQAGFAAELTTMQSDEHRRQLAALRRRSEVR
ncbi:enoyl-CoA hydratase/isomerase family protein [Gordonia sp. NPDC127522]|uniref:enoyl-CoA hydratase/isomerase family protein n=1 Tax=Gordonia sp. NPDC127522 TaxID=3345390 RepID=UPI003643CE2C